MRGFGVEKSEQCPVSGNRRADQAGSVRREARGSRAFLGGTASLVLLGGLFGWLGSGCTLETGEEKDERETTSGSTGDPMPADGDQESGQGGSSLQMPVGDGQQACVGNIRQDLACLDVRLGAAFDFTLGGKNFFDGDEALRALPDLLLAEMDSELGPDADTTIVSGLDTRRFFDNFAVSLQHEGGEFYDLRQAVNGKASFRDLPGGAYRVRLKKSQPFETAPAAGSVGAEDTDTSGANAAAARDTNGQRAWCAAFFSDYELVLSEAALKRDVVNDLKLAVFPGACPQE